MLDVNVGLSDIPRMKTAEIILKAGGCVAVAKAVSRSHSTVSGWEKIPPKHAQIIARMAGIGLADVRPDLFGDVISCPTNESAAA